MTGRPNHGRRPPAHHDELVFMLNCYDVWSGSRADSERCAFAADQEEAK